MGRNKKIIGELHITLRIMF